MTIKNLGEVFAMRRLEGGSLILPKETRRKVRIEFNVDTPASVYAIDRGQDGPGDLSSSRFIADLDGFTVLEFVAEGPLELQVATEANAQVWYFTLEAEQATEANGEETQSFAKLHTPRARDHRAEMMQFQLQQQQMAFMEQMRAEFDRRLAANPGVHPVTGEVIEDVKPSSEAFGTSGTDVSESDAVAGADEPVAEPVDAKAGK
ncbi:hypothetical protein [Tortoise microvirus 79]|nr:hypothetical protein [Tortoise microvirus 79]